MSPEADVAFMENACDRIVRSREPGAGIKRCKDIVMRALGVGENRAYEFLKGKARRVDGFEKDRAREALAEIEAENERRETAEHLAWLQEQIDRHRASGTPFRGPHIDALEHILRGAGSVDRPDTETAGE